MQLKQNYKKQFLTKCFELISSLLCSLLTFIFLTFVLFSNDINKSMDEYLSLGVDDISTASAPLYFISFPSAKDPTWEQRHSGQYFVC